MAERKKKTRLLPVITVIILIAGAFAAYRFFGPNTGELTQGQFLYVHTGSDYEKLKAELQQGNFIADMTSFDFFARRLQLPAHIHAGKYKISKGMSNYKIIRLLRSGRQTPVKLVINKVRTKQELIHLLSTNLEADSFAFRKMFSDPHYLSDFEVDTNTVLCLIMPDTYDFYWNTSADKAFKKIERNHEHFWNEQRRQQAQSHGLTPVKAAILASIVDEESNVREDKPMIASVYLNRLQKGMKLQADPTVKYAVGDFTIHRISGPMLSDPSPYNTYVHEGLPPGPICTPATSSIDAVLQAPKTNYLYFCAKDDFSGRSAFAATFEEQLKNAHAYQKALDARGIH